MATALKQKIEEQLSPSTQHKSPAGHHLAAIQKEAKSRLVIEDRPTPKPKAGEVLVQVRAVAFNPIDQYMRDGDTIIKSWPAVLGNDLAGIILEAGSGVDGVFAKPGTRVAALAPYYYVNDNDYGGFQEKVLIPTEYLIALPDWCTYVEASKLPLGVATAWHGWPLLGLPTDKAYTPQDKKGVLVWGGSSSVGSAVVQIANILGYTVITTASTKHHPLLKSLGAKHVFDYKNEHVVDEIVAVFKAEDVELTFVYDAVGASKQGNAIAKTLNPITTTLLAYAPPVLPNTERVEGVDLRFVEPPEPAEARSKWFKFIYNDWMASVLERGTYKPSPPAKSVTSSSKGLHALNDGLDEMGKGVSGTKLVVEL